MIFDICSVSPSADICFNDAFASRLNVLKKPEKLLRKWKLWWAETIRGGRYPSQRHPWLARQLVEYMKNGYQFFISCLAPLNIDFLTLRDTLWCTIKKMYFLFMSLVLTLLFNLRWWSINIFAQPRAVKTWPLKLSNQHTTKACRFWWNTCSCSLHFSAAHSRPWTSQAREVCPSTFC